MRLLTLLLVGATFACGQDEPDDASSPARPKARVDGPSGNKAQEQPNPAHPSPPEVGVVRGAPTEPSWTDEDTDRATESGLKYKVLKQGDGARPGLGDKVKVHYTGWFVNGKEFDSSHRHGRPAEFALGQVIEGWNEGVPLMQVGARYKFYIPWKLAYGPAGKPPTIPPKADLVFEIELLDVTVLPKHRALDPETVKTTESGLKYEVEGEGEGAHPAADDRVALRYYVWNKDGRLLGSSDAGGRPLSGRCSALRLSPRGEKFLKEAAQLLRKGGRARFEVPPELCWGDQALHPQHMPANSTSWWLLELTDVSSPPAMPTFRALDGSETKTTESGLKYEVIREGTGKKPTSADRVSVYYTGWLTNGTEFDSGHRRGEPTSFGVTQVIPGWIEGLQLMQEGSIYLFEIPSDIAYGARRAGKIPPNSTLIFLVELLEVQ